MLLAIDVGNTNMVFGIYKGVELIGSFRISTDERRTSDELGMMITQYYTFLKVKIKNTSDIIIASVVPQVMHTVVNAVLKFIGRSPLIVGEDVLVPIENLYLNPKDVGVDRLVNSFAASAKFGRPLIVVDMGTATTFDVVDCSGAYVGGAIFPGIKVSMEALFMTASKLPRIDIVYPKHAIGKTTAHSMQSGAMHGYIGAIEGIIFMMQSEMQAHAQVIATGGLARMISQHSKVVNSVDSNLTLEGLKLIYDKLKIRG